MSSRGRVFNLSVCLLVCLPVYPPLPGRFACSSGSHEVIIHLIDR